ncbi:hypothetical protein PUN28_020327 [Cardiocondyla obscurior]|uniref:Uncharacterized protein n=1 Tax=Cardiocondyla obscurior TaxID=286306 RepID=A0AAW2E9B9_9HYME
MLSAALEAQTWTRDTPAESVSEDVEKLCGALTSACDTAMPRISSSLEEQTWYLLLRVSQHQTGTTRRTKSAWMSWSAWPKELDPKRRLDQMAYPGLSLHYPWTI